MNIIGPPAKVEDFDIKRKRKTLTRLIEFPSMPEALFECPELGFLMVDELVEDVSCVVWWQLVAVSADDWG